MSIGLFLLRLIVGGIFAVHGYPKLFGGSEEQVHPQVARYLGPGFVQALQHGRAGFVAMLREMNIPVPEATGLFVGAVEFFGGILLILGWCSRLAALLLGGDMVVAIWKVHWKAGLVGAGAFEFPLSLLGACLALFFAGPGKISVDQA